MDTQPNILPLPHPLLAWCTSSFERTNVVWSSLYFLDGARLRARNAGPLEFKIQPTLHKQVVDWFSPGR